MLRKERVFIFLMIPLILKLCSLSGLLKKSHMRIMVDCYLKLDLFSCAIVTESIVNKETFVKVRSYLQQKTKAIFRDMLQQF